jgi:transposase
MEASVEQVSIIGLDIAKQVFQAHGADASGEVVFRDKIRRAKLLEFFASKPPCTVVMEACGGAHHWGREIAKLGHQVKLIAPKYVKPFVKRQKNDAADAEAICEAAMRPTMRFVAVKSQSCQTNSARLCCPFDKSVAITRPPCSRQIPSVRAAHAKRRGSADAAGC